MRCVVAAPPLLRYKIYLAAARMEVSEATVSKFEFLKPPYFGVTVDQSRTFFSVFEISH